MNYIFKFFTSISVLLYQLSGGKIGGQMGKFKVLLLTTKGRKSGKTYVHPLGYFERDGGYYIVASNLGRDIHPAWYFNIKGNPGDVMIQIGDKKMKVQPQIVLGEPRRPVYDWIASIAPNYGSYEKKTSREIPLVLLKAM
jgi:deazaflavin-dependent oxidoreductase (nitroreductase family)